MRYPWPKYDVNEELYFIQYMRDNSPETLEMYLFSVTMICPTHTWIQYNAGTQLPNLCWRCCEEYPASL